MIKPLPTLDDKVNPGHALVMVIDMQNDFCHERGSVARRGHDPSLGREMAPRLLAFVEEARRYHLPIIHTQNTYGPWTDSPAWMERHARYQGMGIEHCIEGTWGWEFYKIIPQPGELILKKSRWSAFVGTSLETNLRTLGTRTLILTGVNTSICVENTARHGLMLDYYIVFLDDCTAATSQDAHQQALERVRSFATVTTSREVVGAWKRLAR